MLLIARSMRELSFDKLMKVYVESNRLRGMQLASEETDECHCYLAEQDFYDYLSNDFFRIKGSCYVIWQEAGEYISAFRLEPYQDGLLLAGLETVPEMRGRGYAKKLIAAFQEMQGTGTVLYSHVRKGNASSMKVHLACQFSISSDYARYIDGTVSQDAYTLVFEK